MRLFACTSRAQNPYPDVFEQIETRRREAEAAMAEAMANLEGFRVIDAEAKSSSVSFVPDVQVIPGAATPYIKYGDLEIGAQFIESITASPGSGPHLSFLWGGEIFATPGLSIITIATISGGRHEIRISRWHADALIAALLKTWKENR